ncbi:MAG: hypothetical protein V1859_08585 [archaeon]
MFLANYTAASIGILFIGAGITLKLKQTKINENIYVYLWIVMFVLISALLVLQYVKDSIN